MRLAQTAGPQSASRRGGLLVGCRVAVSVLGSYAFCWGFVTLGTVLGVTAGLAYVEASTLVSLIVFLVFAAAFCWTFLEESLLRVCAVLGGGGALMTLLGWLGSRALS